MRVVSGVVEIVTLAGWLREELDGLWELMLLVSPGLLLLLSPVVTWSRHDVGMNICMSRVMGRVCDNAEFARVCIGDRKIADSLIVHVTRYRKNGIG